MIAPIVLIASSMITAGASQAEIERRLIEAPQADSLRAAHELFCTEPHPAGSPGDARMIEKLTNLYKDMGVEVHQHWFETYLSTPVSGGVEIVATGDTGDVLPIVLPVKERAVDNDPDSGHPDLSIGWNAYAATGDVQGNVVYANRGTKQDFETLERLGIDCTGKIVIARYGGNFRGYKAKFATEAGAIGLIIYTDPADGGPNNGATWPEGGYANDSYIQRGSILTLPYPGDPLSPGVPAGGEEYESLDPADVAFPTIPVQPIGWGAAREILSRMEGDPVPDDIAKRWTGGFDFPYRIDGGPALSVRVHVEQERDPARSANIIAKIEGATHPQELVVLGCHFDAWGFGAADPHAGSIVLQEVARGFAELAKDDIRPERTIIFAHWACEEYGIIGSTEWVEANERALAHEAIAYINLDMAAMGETFGVGASPMLRQVIEDATRSVPQARAQSDGETAWDRATNRGERDMRFGSLGGGSDHVGFYCRLGVPSAGIAARGAKGISYHSNYDNLAWYRAVVGDDYEPAIMLTRIAAVLAARLANEPIVPYDFSRATQALRTDIESLQKRAQTLGRDFDFEALFFALESLEEFAHPTMASLNEVRANHDRLDEGSARKINLLLKAMPRRWYFDPGLPERPWYRNLYGASDPDSGYAAWVFPALRLAVERDDRAMFDSLLPAHVRAIRSIRRDIARVRYALPPDPAADPSSQD